MKVLKLKHREEVPKRMWYNEVTNGLNIMSLLLNSCLTMCMRDLLIEVPQFFHSK